MDGYYHSLLDIESKEDYKIVEAPLKDDNQSKPVLPQRNEKWKVQIEKVADSLF